MSNETKSNMALPSYAHVFGSDVIRVGLVGCGGRGTGAASNAVEAAEGVEIYAMGDLFKDRLDSSRENLKGLGARFNVTDDRCFVGFDAYKKVIASDVHYVLFATPPGFRPIQARAAIEAGKHIFVEKPVAVCPTGIRHFIETSKMASAKGLGVLAGTQYRHDPRFVETIKRIHDGAIGDILAGQIYYLTGELWHHGRKPDWTDAEFQIRNWLYFNWLAGDHIIEQHVHNIDVMCWVMNGHPEKALAMGGRQKRVDPKYGHIYDHFTTLYDYPDNVKWVSMCRQMDNTQSRVTDHVVGTKGTSCPWGWIRGETNWRFQGPHNMYVQEHADFIASLRAGKPLNEGVQVAESTLTGIMGRMSAYTGQEVTWEQAMNSQLNLMRDVNAFGPIDSEPIAIPGKTALV